MRKSLDECQEQRKRYVSAPCASFKKYGTKYLKKVSTAEMQRLRQDVNQDKTGEIGSVPILETLLQGMLSILFFISTTMGILQCGPQKILVD